MYIQLFFTLKLEDKLCQIRGPPAVFVKLVSVYHMSSILSIWIFSAVYQYVQLSVCHFLSILSILSVSLSKMSVVINPIVICQSVIPFDS